MKKLEVGDVVYIIGRNGITGRTSVTNVTEIRAGTKYRVFKREVDADGWLNEIGAGAYPTESCRIASPELDIQWEEVKDRRVFKEAMKDIDNLPIEKVRAILKILSDE